MRLFRIYVDGNLFYHPQLSSLAVTKAQVQEDAESIDSLTLSAPFNHPYLADIKPMSSVVVCKRGDDTVFEGRALDNGTDFYNTHTWTCESDLAYLKDTIQPPYDYSGTLGGLLEYFISGHNTAVEDKKKFMVGNVTVTDDNDYVHYSSSDYTVMMDAIRQKLLGTHGGYLRLRCTADGKVLDYLADFSETSLQTVEYGKNLTDVKINTDHTERATALIPLGAKVRETDDEGNETETDRRIDITYISSHTKQEHLYEVYATEPDKAFWRELAKCNQEEFEKSSTNGKCIEARELMIALPESFINYDHDYLLKKMVDKFKEKYGVECFAALHHNKRKTNLHIHMIFAERKRLDQPEEKTATRNMFYDEQGRHVRTKKEILGGDGNIRKGCKIIKKGEVYERKILTVKDERFKQESFLDEAKVFYTDLHYFTRLRNKALPLKQQYQGLFNCI